ncbi:MAG: hypothetical protein DRJ33_04400 [Candidatus Methanomethylicota archaeon]|uniref:Peptidase S49 domain-containing protein n=1 Tax=Thermoproteota archaeon TaxID=2056631 RepID=A0A497EXP9_9CREN|nr:MAG: hypothetical protein DRJ33_04400 [Candidatus Verstraetearchaeota archaeon]
MHLKGKYHITVIAIIAAIAVAVSVLHASAYLRSESQNKNLIAVVEVNTPIIYTSTRDFYTSLMQYALQNVSIKAVVLKLDSPGGSVSAIQDVYLQLLKLKAEKPVVTSILAGALSGGYYIAVVADYIYALPMSLVGSIGVIAIKPTQPYPSEKIVETGPYKYTGLSELDFYELVNQALQDFINTIKVHRGSKLKVPETELMKSAIYTGLQARAMGLVDEIGNLDDAIKKAAQLAEVEEYQVVFLNKEVKQTPTTWYTSQTQAIKCLEDLANMSTPPSLYYLYLPSLKPKPITEVEVIKQEAFQAAKSPSKSIAFDVGHQNAYASSDIELLIKEICSRGRSISFVKNLVDVSLEKYNAIVIISPTKPYTQEERKAIRNYLEQGGKLLLIYDPEKAAPNAINTIATDFQITFATGYLYNLENNDKNYRNIYITSLDQNNTITQGVDKLILYTATAIYTTKGAIAMAQNTWLTTANVKSNYPVIVARQGVVAISDQTFLKEPYAHQADNMKLIHNIAKYLTS